MIENTAQTGKIKQMSCCG